MATTRASSMALLEELGPMQVMDGPAAMMIPMCLDTRRVMMYVIQTGSKAKNGRLITLQIKYKTLGWPMVAVLMIAEIVSNGMLSLPSSLAVVGMAPGLILIIFLGIFATYTSWLLVKFKMRHPEVHNMGDAGKILFGPIGRELLAFGTVVFAVFATGGQLLAGSFAISALSNNTICPLLGNGKIHAPPRWDQS